MRKEMSLRERYRRRVTVVLAQDPVSPNASVARGNPSLDSSPLASSTRRTMVHEITVGHFVGIFIIIFGPLFNL